MVYAVCAAGWVLLSDSLVELIGIPALHTYKGIAFVMVTAGVLYVYLRHKVSQQRDIERDLAKTAESKGRLVAAVSHDLRQPLQSLSLFASVVESDPAIGSQSRRAISMLNESVDRMGQLLNAILEMARLDAGIVTGERMPVKVGQLLETLAGEMQGQADAKGLRLIRMKCSAVVESDPVLLMAIIRNLVANAIRYTERGKVLIGCRRHGAQYMICVYDTGVGIDADRLELVFEEFYQIGNPSRDSRLGLGLGLSIVERLTRLLGHRLVVRSEIGKGSAFCVIVPAGKA